MTPFFNPLRRFFFRLLKNLAYRLWPEGDLGEKAFSQSGVEELYDQIPKGQYDYVPKGTYVYGPANKFLLVPKNRYRAVLLPDQHKSAELGVGWLTEDNSAEGYDQLWGDKSNLETFRAEADHVRDKLTVEIVDHIEKYIRQDAKVVDIGCGVGDLLIEVSKRFPEVAVHGLDFSAKAVEGARSVLPKGEFKQFVIENSLPYTPESFDLVFCTDVLEHLENPKLIASELVRICRPEGLVVIVVPDGEVDQFFGHYWFWNEQSLAELLADWNAQILRLPQTREFMAFIAVNGRMVVDHAS
jgi:2-polyprenyl-3-methyl-5-hydroxy-6-metoxy-1,4-benzoquinol methylase